MILALRCNKCGKYDDWEKVEIPFYCYCNCGAVWLMPDLRIDNLAQLLLIYPLAEQKERGPLYLDPNEFNDNDEGDEE